MENLGEMYSNISIPSLIIVGLVIILIVGIALLFIKYSKKKNKLPKTSRAYAGNKLATVDAPDVPEPDEDGAETEGDAAGGYPAYICTLKGGFDFDHIPKPLGDVFLADTTMPRAGACYLVKETAANEYEAYDPRTAPVLSDESPVKAWFATHWDIVKDVYGVATPWFKNVSLWIAGLAGAAAFIIVLAKVG
jgi:hypothetical protein